MCIRDRCRGFPKIKKLFSKEIGEKLFVLLIPKQQQELKQFIMDIECGKIRLADISSCPFGSHVICCMNKNAGKAKFEIEKDDLFFSLEQRLVTVSYTHLVWFVSSGDWVLFNLYGCTCMATD